ncbi:RdRp [Hubei virga-like virus 16]|uniref:RdRp n=1 Tax=Hubei virga-like virus 16 TaxID=1923331 RepID=UPI000909B527|nr:RdRp [Hubei virga-like virus 16]APG77522.1 RdRp [Hubei virga-like virus 16]
MGEVLKDALRYVHEDFVKDKDTIVKAAIEEALKGNQTSSYRQLVADRVVHEVCNSTGAYKPKKEVVVPFHLTASEMKLLEDNYPGFKIVFTHETNNSHAFAAAHRVIEYHEVQNKLGYNPNHDYTEYLRQTGRDVYVTDVGANFPARARQGEVFVHCCSPVLDNADSQRHTGRVGKFDSFLANTKVMSENSRIVCGHITDVLLNRATETSSFCMNTIQNCKISSPKGMAIHSLYDITFAQLGKAMLDKQMYMVIGTLSFDDSMFQYKKGVVKESKMTWEYVDDYKRIKCGFEGDASRSYVHDVRTYFGWMMVSMFMYNGVKFHIELLERVAGVVYVSVVAELVVPPTNERIFHNIPLLSNKGKVMVVVRYRDIDLACEELPTLSFWRANTTLDGSYKGDVEFFSRSGDRNLFKKDLHEVHDNGDVTIRFYISSELYEVGKGFALGNSEAKFKPVEIFQFIRSYATKQYYGKELTRRYDIDYMQVYHLAYAIYLTCYDQKYIVGKSCEKKLKGENRNRELQRMSVFRRMCKVLGNTLLTAVLFVPPISFAVYLHKRLDLWTYKMLRDEFVASEAVIAPVESVEHVTTLMQSDGKPITYATMLPVTYDTSLGLAIRDLVTGLVFDAIGPGCRSEKERTCVSAVDFRDKGKKFVLELEEAGPSVVVVIENFDANERLSEWRRVVLARFLRVPVGGVLYLPYQGFTGDDDFDELVSDLAGCGLVLTVVEESVLESVLYFRLERVEVIDSYLEDTMIENRLVYSTGFGAASNGYVYTVSGNLCIVGGTGYTVASAEINFFERSWERLAAKLEPYSSERIDRTKELLFPLAMVSPQLNVKNRSACKLSQLITLTDSGLLKVAKVLDLCAYPGGFADLTFKKNPLVTYYCVSKRGGEGQKIESRYIPARAIDLTPDDYFDLTDVECRDKLVEQVGVVDTVLADGAVELYGRYDLQEEANFWLIRSEILTAIKILGERGNLLLKIFAMRMPGTRTFVTLLTTCFRSVKIVKPPASWSVNTELYVLCEGFVVGARTSAVNSVLQVAARSVPTCEVLKSTYDRLTVVAENYTRSGVCALQKLVDRLSRDIAENYGSPLVALVAATQPQCDARSGKGPELEKPQNIIVPVIESEKLQDLNVPVIENQSTGDTPKETGVSREMLECEALVNNLSPAAVVRTELLRLRFQASAGFRSDHLKLTCVSNINFNCEYVVFRTPSDGNCFFHALGLNIFDHRLLREHFLNTSTDPDVVEDCRQIGHVAGTSTIAEAVRQFKVSIVQFDSVHLSAGRYGDSGPQTTVFYTRNHFEVTLPYCLGCPIRWFTGSLNVAFPDITVADFMNRQFTRDDVEYYLPALSGCVHCQTIESLVVLPLGVRLLVCNGFPLPDHLAREVRGGLEFAYRPISDCKPLIADVCPVVPDRKGVVLDDGPIGKLVKRYRMDPMVAFAHCISSDFGSRGHMTKGVALEFVSTIGRPSAQHKIVDLPLTEQRFCEMHPGECQCPIANRSGARVLGVLTKPRFNTRPTLTDYKRAMKALFDYLKNLNVKELIIPCMGTALDRVPIEEFYREISLFTHSNTELLVRIVKPLDRRKIDCLIACHSAVVPETVGDVPESTDPASDNYVCSALVSTGSSLGFVMTRGLMDVDAATAEQLGYNIPVHRHSEYETCAPVLFCDSCDRIPYFHPLRQHVSNYSTDLSFAGVTGVLAIAALERSCYRCTVLGYIRDTNEKRIIFLPYDLHLEHELERPFIVHHYHGAGGVYLLPASSEDSAVRNLSSLVTLVSTLQVHDRQCQHASGTLGYNSRLRCYTDCVTLQGEMAVDRVRVVDSEPSTSGLVLELKRGDEPSVNYFGSNKLVMKLVYSLESFAIEHFDESVMLLRNKLSALDPAKVGEVVVLSDAALDLSTFVTATRLSDFPLVVVRGRTEGLNETTRVHYPVFRHGTSDKDFQYNAMQEMKYIWSRTTTDWGNNIRALLAPYMLTDGVIKPDTASKVNDVSLGIIDAAVGTWFVVPVKQEEDGYSYAYAYGTGGEDGFVKFSGVVRNLTIDKERLAEVRRVSSARYFVVTKHTKVMNEQQLLDSVSGQVVLDSLLDFEIRIVEGVPGAGKTHYIVQNHDPSENFTEIVATATKEAAADLRLRSGYGESTSATRQKFARRKYRTLDSLTIHMTKDYQKGEVKTIYFDESSMKHVGQIFWCAMVLGVRRVIICGDRAQIAYFNSEGYQHQYHRFPREPDVRLTVTKRCPVDVCYLLSGLRAETGESLYPVPITTSNPGMRSLHIYRDTTALDLGDSRDTQILTFTQLEKQEVSRKYSGFSVNTIGEYQGKESKNIVLIRTSTKNTAIYSDLSQMVVALSRHTNDFRYYSIVDDDLSRLIGIATRAENQQLLKHAVTVKGGGYVFNTSRILRGEHDSNRFFPRLQPYSQLPIYDVRLKPDYAKDLLKESHVLRDLVVHHGEIGYVSFKPTMTDLTANFGAYEEEEKVTTFDWASAKSMVQLFADHVKPGSTCDSTRYDYDVFEQSPFHIDGGGFAVSTDFVVRRRPDTLTPTLRTPCPPYMLPTQKQVIKAFLERNGGVPESDGRIPSYVYCKRIVDAFKRNMVADHDLLRFYTRNPMTVNVDSVTDWISYQDPNILTQLEKDPDYSIFEKKLSEYSYILKRLPKPSLDDVPQLKNSSPQAIAHLDKKTNAIFSPLVRDMKHRLYSVLRWDKVVCSDVSVEDFEKIMTNRLPPRVLKEYPYRFETDFGKYDKSQAVLALMIDVTMMEMFGVPKELILCWILMHVSTRLVALNQRFTARVDYQRKSGDPMTFLGNTMYLMCVLAYQLDGVIGDGFGVFAGDDSYLFLKKPVDEVRFIKSCAAIFNLEVKILKFKAPYFCSKFLLPVNDVKWVCVPDVWKTVIKLGRDDLVNFKHVEEYRVSLCDNLRSYTYQQYWEFYAEAVSERYSLDFLPTYIFPAVYALISDPEKFKSLYYVSPGDVIDEAQVLLPSLEI